MKNTILFYCILQSSNYMTLTFHVSKTTRPITAIQRCELHFWPFGVTSVVLSLRRPLGRGFGLSRKTPRSYLALRLPGRPGPPPRPPRASSPAGQDLGPDILKAPFMSGLRDSPGYTGHSRNPKNMPYTSLSPITFYEARSVTIDAKARLLS